MNINTVFDQTFVLIIMNIHSLFKFKSVLITEDEGG